MAGEAIVELTNENFEQEVVSHPGTVMVDFWAPWCGPCRMVGPVVEELAKEYEGKAKVAKLNTERGDLAGTLIVGGGDEVLVVLASGKVVRSDVAEVPAKGRDTMGVVFAKFDADDRIIAIAKNSERNLTEEAAEPEAAETAGEE